MSKELTPLPSQNYVDEDGLWAERFGPYDAEQMIAYAADAVRAAIASREGWVLVPTEPTPEMVRAIADNISLMNFEQGSIAGYRAALAASPKVE